MRSFTIDRRPFRALVAAAMSLVCTMAAAGELLVMPYACEMSGGAPLLTPSRDQGYRVLGARESRDFTACSPANPDMCRRWKVHRFDVECGGKRVSWLSVSAAADSLTGGRSWIADGRLHVQMPPRWNLQPDDPCARRGRFGPRFGAESRHCADRPMADVEMPVGFAPMLDLDAIFVAEETLPPSGAVAAPAAPIPKPMRAEAPPPAPRAEKPVKAPAPPSEPASKAAPAPMPPAPTPATKPAPPPPTATPTETAMATGTPLAPTIINGANAPEAKSEPQPAITAPETTSALAGAEATVPPTKVSETGSEPASSAEPQRQGEKSIAVALVEGLAQSVNPTWFGVGGVTLLGLLALLLAARRSETEPDFARARDIATVSLDGRPGSREVARTGRWLATTPRRDRQPPVPAPAGGAPAPAWGDAIPETRDEALRVLGMGVAADVTDGAIKKIIDGLRMSWHPDYAKSAEDRELRELRTKQINAAWDIITAKRAS